MQNDPSHSPQGEDMEEVDLPLVPLGQVVQGTGWGDRAVVLPPLWEGLYLMVELDMGSPLRDFLQGLISHMGNTRELPPALMSWMERQQRAMDEMGGAPHQGGWFKSI